MRMMVFFDLPMVTRAEKRAYTVFRRFLLNDGYDMIQFSVYGRILNGSDAEQKHLKRLTANLPPAGSVRVLTVTEKQYASMLLLVGLPLFQEKKLGLAQHRLGVEDLIADRTGGHEAASGQHQPCLADLVAVDHDGRAVAACGVGDARLLQRRRDLAGLAQVEVGIEQRVRGLADAGHHEDQGDGHARADPQHHGQATDPESLQRRRKAAHASPPRYWRGPAAAPLGRNCRPRG